MDVGVMDVTADLPIDLPATGLQCQHLLEVADGAFDVRHSVHALLEGRSRYAAGTLLRAD